MSSPSCDSTDGSLRIYEQYAEFHCGDPPTVAVKTLPKALLPQSMQISLHQRAGSCFWLCMRDFVLTVQATITFKWNSWAKRCLLVELCLYLTWLIAFQVFVLLFQASCAAHLSFCLTVLSQLEFWLQQPNPPRVSLGISLQIRCYPSAVQIAKACSLTCGMRAIP